MMNINKLSTKITLFVAVLIIVTTTLIAAIIIYNDRNTARQEVLDDSLLFADYVSESIYRDYLQYYTHPSQTDFETFKNLVTEKLERVPDIYQVKLIGINGTVLFDSSEFEEGKYSGSERKITDEEILEMIRTHGIAYIESQDQIAISRAVNSNAGVHVVSMFYNSDYASAREVVLESFIRAILLFIPLLILSIILTILFINTITKPLTLLTNAAKRIQAGEKDVTVVSNSKDEIGELSAIFNQMAKSIEKSRVALEDRVKQRTAELENKNAELEKFNQLVVGRELKMAELKEEIKSLKNKLSEK